MICWLVAAAQMCTERFIAGVAADIEARACRSVATNRFTVAV